MIKELVKSKKCGKKNEKIQEKSKLSVFQLQTLSKTMPSTFYWFEKNENENETRKNRAVEPSG